MNEIAGYQIVKQLFSSPKTIVYQALDSDKTPVILKMITEQFLSSKELALFNSEYKINSIFSSPLIIKTIKLTNHGNLPVMVLNDIEGTSLKDLIIKSNLGYFADNLELGLNIAISIVKAIAEIHDKSVIHKDINPSNIVYNQSDNRLNIIDFGLSSELSFENFDLSNINLLEGSLAYISPEQTGRINRNIDYRTDYYSIGITLYEMFSGHLPFHATSAREWVYCQIAKEPVPLIELNKKIPEALSRIVAKLIEKTAEMRYQSPFGIIADLMTCFDSIKENRIIDDFEPGKSDISRKFQISQKLYGREKEIEQILTAFKQLPEHNSIFISVKGEPGAGKSTLIGELYRPITEKDGYFISGKFEQFKKDIPYYAFINAFTKLFQTIITESEESVALWKEKLITALAGNAHLIIDLIPELKLLIGIQPVPTELSSIEAHNRFVLTFQKMVDVFADAHHPLVIFIDDLQWADHASLDLLKALLIAQKKRAFLCIGAYRQNEILAGHPLLFLIESIEKAKIKILEIEIHALKASVIEDLVKDTFNCSQIKAKELALVCFQKTIGNPFFLNAFLSNLYRSNKIRYNSLQGLWEWEIGEIEKSDVTNNVLDLICNRIRELSENTQNALKQASCIGSKFTIGTLSLISEKSKKELVVHLKEALTESLILPLAESYRFAEFDINPNTEYKFIHDRVLQATYSLIEDSSKEITHLKIARLLLNSYSEREIKENIFILIEHFNKSINILDNYEKIQLSELNLAAALKAKASSAFHQASKYLAIGLSLITDECWESNYLLALESHSLMAEIAFLCEDKDKMNEMIDKVKFHAISALDQTYVYETHLLALSFDHQYQQAIYEGVEFIGKFGISIPKKAGVPEILYLLATTGLSLRKISSEKITELPLITNPEAQAALRIMGMLITPSYYANPLLFPILAFHFVRLTLKYGLSPISPLGFITYGMILNSVLGKIDSGYQYGQLGIKLLERVNDKKYWANTSCIYHAALCFWKEPIKNATNGFIEDYRIALETGNIEYATTSIAVCLSYKLFEGGNLNELYATFNDYENFLLQWPKQPNTFLLKAFLQIILNLQESKPHPEILTGEKCNEEQMIEEALFVKDYSQMASLFANKFMMAYLFNNFKEAFDILYKSKKWIKNITNLLQYPIYIYYKSLLYLSLYPTFTKGKKLILLREVRLNQNKLIKWANHTPMNFLHKYQLVEAEIARVKGKTKKAIEHYNNAITLAKHQACMVDEALGYELMAKFWLELNDKELAGIYFVKASKTYGLWGATAKVDQLTNNYNELISAQNPAHFVNIENQKILSTSLSISASLDIETLMDAAKTISGEIVLSELIKKIIGIILQHAGAQKGLLLLKDKTTNELLIKASGIIENEKQKISLLNDEITQENLPLTLIRFVSHKMQPLIVSNALNDEGYTKDAYIQKHQLKSALVLPLIHQAKLIGIIYLENNLATNVFTAQHLTVLNLLSSQIGISIENAFLYENLEIKVAERTEQIKIQAEELKASNEKLIELDQFKEGMTGMIVHDLKNPLNTILSISKEPETRQAGNQMLNMVLNILDIQKFESAQMKIYPTEFLLNLCITGALKQVKLLCEKKSIVIENTILNDVAVKGDFDLINRVFINLLTNAIKYTSNNGRIKLTADDKLINAENDLTSHDYKNNDNTFSSFLMIKIIDNGQGINPEKINTVFDKYSQAEVKSSGNVRSTGLGLTFCKMAVEAHGGKIGVYSKLEKGSTFWFLLPKGNLYEFEIKPYEIERKESFVLKDEDKIYLSAFKNQLIGYSVYEFSDVNIILKNIEHKNISIVHWKMELENALRACNEEKYAELIGIIS